MSSGQLVCEFELSAIAAGGFGSPEEVESAEKEAAGLLHAALGPAILLDQLPKCAVKVHCLVLQCGGTDFASAVCGASVALCDAGVPLRGLVAACVVADVCPSSAFSSAAPKKKKGGKSSASASSTLAVSSELVLDPSLADIFEGVNGLVTVASMFTHNATPSSPELSNDGSSSVVAASLWEEGLTHFSQTGQLDGVALMSALSLARSGSSQVRAAMARSLEAATCLGEARSPSSRDE
jgi:ribonuclease PH